MLHGSVGVPGIGSDFLFCLLPSAFCLLPSAFCLLVSGFWFLLCGLWFLVALAAFHFHPSDFSSAPATQPSFRTEQADAFSSRLAPARRSACPERNLFASVVAAGFSPASFQLLAPVAAGL